MSSSNRIQNHLPQEKTSADFKLEKRTPFWPPKSILYCTHYLKSAFENIHGII